MQEDELTRRIIGAAIAVHRTLGPGYLESLYEEALCLELSAAGVSYERQFRVEIMYRGRRVGEHRLDLLVEEAVVVELKAVQEFQDIFYATLRSYLRATGKSTGLMLNFSAVTLQTRRVGPNMPPKAAPSSPRGFPASP